VLFAQIKAANARPKVLRIDDEIAMTSNLAPFLERAGFAARALSDGAAGLPTTTVFQPGLIVTDGFI